MDAQRRLRNSRVLVCNMRGLAAEVAKNLVLAGVKSLKMLDKEVYGEADYSTNFLAPRNKVIILSECPQHRYFVCNC